MDLPVENSLLLCPACGHGHERVSLRSRERALCVRCGTVVARGRHFGTDGALAATLTGLVLAVPAMLLPFMTAGKLGNERVSLLFSSVDGLWDGGLRLLAVWVFLCSALVPIALLGTLAGLLLPAHFGWQPLKPVLLARAAHAMVHWAMPEVQVLAVLVALMKLGRLVHVTIGWGFWCYAGMSFALLLAWRGVDLEAVAVQSAAESESEAVR